MPKIESNGIELEYELIGNPSDPTLLLITGLGMQLIRWPEEFCQQLADRGFLVVRFDNRDSGLSTKSEGLPEIFSIIAGDTSTAPYLLSDMADDTAGLVKGLGFDRVHVMGVSMGGMITQALAIQYPELVRSACSIMSTTGDRAVGAPTSEALQALMRPVATSREEAVVASVAGTRVISSPGFPFDEAWVTAQAERSYDRCYCPEGTARQLAAILASPDRTEHLRQLDLPFLVVHGDGDPLINVSGGVATAEAVPGAEFMLIPGMGHDLPQPVWGQIIDGIVKNIEHAGR